MEDSISSPNINNARIKTDPKSLFTFQMQYYKFEFGSPLGMFARKTRSYCLVATMFNLLLEVANLSLYKDLPDSI